MVENPSHDYRSPQRSSIAVHDSYGVGTIGACYIGSRISLISESSIWECKKKRRNKVSRHASRMSFKPWENILCLVVWFIVYSYGTSIESTP